MQSTFIFSIFFTLHVALYGTVGKFSMITVIGATIWSAISVGLYAFATLVTVNRKAWAIGLSWLLVSAVYFMTFILIQAPAFRELSQFGLQIIQHGAITRTGLIYVLVESVLQGGLLAATVCIVGYVRNSSLRRIKD